ncbi:transcription termination factor, mitochondrial isoform X1 [Ixodes scapularis]
MFLGRASGARWLAASRRYCSGLRDLMGFADESEYKSWYARHPELSKLPEERLAASCRSLLGRLPGARAHIRAHPALLTVSEASLERRLSLLEECKALPLTLLSYPESLLQYVVKKLGLTGLRNQLSHMTELLASRLGLDEVGALQLVEKHPCLLTQEPGRLERVLELLLGAGVSREAILKDPWVFRHNEEVMRARVERVSQAGTPVRPWMLRCPEETLERHLERWSARRTALGPHTDTLHYLAERLRCSGAYVRFLADRNPRLLTINAPKLKQVLDLLFANGYTPEQVCLFPRVLSCSLGRLERRLGTLRALPGAGESALPSLYLLNATEKEFVRACRRRLLEQQLYSRQG